MNEAYPAPPENVTLTITVNRTETIDHEIPASTHTEEKQKPVIVPSIPLHT